MTSSGHVTSSGSCPKTQRSSCPGSTTCALVSLQHHVTYLLEANSYVRCLITDFSKDHGHFAIGCPLESSPYLASFPRYLAPKLRQRLLRDDVINSRHLAFGETGSRSIRSAVPENPTIGSNRKSIGPSVPEIWLFAHVYGQKSYCTCARDLGVGVKSNHIFGIPDPELPTTLPLSRGYGDD